MKSVFHYEVKVKLVRYITQDEINFITHKKTFENENPIIARVEAFKEYHEWINDLYAGLGKEGQYTTDKQARIDLSEFVTPPSKHKVQIDKNDIDFGNTSGYGIGVYFIVDQPFNQNWQIEKDMLDKVGDEYLLHGIGNTINYNDPLEISDALNNEICYYEHYQYEKGIYERRVNFYDSFLGEMEEIHFLETPFDWTGLDKEPIEENFEVNQSSNTSIEEIIASGEGNQVEFKPSLLYNFKTNKAGIGIKRIIATAICAFLNSNGGVLIIGLSDDGKPQGLESDFSLANGKKPKDFFQNEFDQMIEHFLTFSVKPNITGQFYEIENKVVFVVLVEPWKNRPIFLKGQHGKEFWVRGNAGNRQLTDIEEITNYCIEKW